ncbi:MAG: DUF2461 domain-containing protein [Cyclobacteriaceae bacterium]
MPITNITLSFLQDIADNNNREWFENNKERYLVAQQEMKSFHGSLANLMTSHDQITKGRVYRIYRDVRFSKDKTPYKNNWGGGFQRETHYLRGGYYYQIQPGNSFAAGGFFGPNSQDLLHIRKQIQQEPDRLKELLTGKEFVSTFGELKGEQVKTAPKGFSKDDPAIELLRYKQLYVERHFTDEDVLDPDFGENLSAVFAKMRPYFDYMSEILTTDLNGEELITG